MFRHFLITRFNVNYGWEKSRNGEAVQTEEWLARRFALFETFCLPSVKNQSNQNFTWIVLLDVDTPEIFRKRISAAAEYPNLQPVYIAGKETLKKSVVEAMQRNLSPSDQYVISTRMDNDDLIHRDFIAHIQTLFRPVHRTVIDLRKGFQLSMENYRCEMRSYRKNFNPFISVIEDVDDLQSVHSCMHKEWRHAGTILREEKKKLWIELVHPMNMWNETFHSSRKTYSFQPEEYGIGRNLVQLENPVAIFLFNLKLAIKYLFNQELRKKNPRE